MWWLYIMNPTVDTMNIYSAHLDWGVRMTDVYNAHISWCMGTTDIYGAHLYWGVITTDVYGAHIGWGMRMTNGLLWKYFEYPYVEGILMSHWWY